jgi:hypothetical protein
MMLRFSATFTALRTKLIALTHEEFTKQNGSHLEILYELFTRPLYPVIFNKTRLIDEELYSCGTSGSGRARNDHKEPQEPQQYFAKPGEAEWDG